MIPWFNINEEQDKIPLSKGGKGVVFFRKSE